MSQANQSYESKTFDNKKRSVLTDPNYSAEKEVDEMLYKKTGFKQKKSSVSFYFGYNCLLNNLYIA